MQQAAHQHRHPHGHRHTIHADHQYLNWDNSRPPAITVAPGETVEFRDIDASCGQITAESDVSVIPGLDFTRVNAISGPVHVDGAEPGDALKIRLLDFSSAGWAWTAIIPGFGLLAEDFSQPALHIWKVAPDLRAPASFGSHARIPLRPFCGTIGVAPPQPGQFSTVPPYHHGGNMDTKDLTADTDLYLPVQVPGGLFSLGDTHSAQGDGEVCGTAIETPMTVTARIDLVKGADLKFPRFVTDGPVSRHIDGSGYDATMGIAPDLMQASKDAVRGMIDLLGKERGLSPEIAYMLCSVCADLRISEVVDIPNWVVSCYMPRSVFE